MEFHRLAQKLLRLCSVLQENFQIFPRDYSGQSSRFDMPDMPSYHGDYKEVSVWILRLNYIMLKKRQKREVMMSKSSRWVGKELKLWQGDVNIIDLNK